MFQPFLLFIYKVWNWVRQRKNRWLEHLWGLCYTYFYMNLQSNPVRDSYRLSCKWGNFTMASFQIMQPFVVPILSRHWAGFVPIQLSTTFLQLLPRTRRHRRTHYGIQKVRKTSWKRHFFDRTKRDETGWRGQRGVPHDETHRLIKP